MPELVDKKFFSNKIFLILLFGLFITIIIDISFVQIYDLINKNFIPIGTKEIIFSVNTAVCLMFQLLIVRYINTILTQPRFGNLSYNKYYLGSLISFLLIGFIILFLIYQQIFENYYSKQVLILIVVLAYLTAILMLTRLLWLFIEWFRIKKDIVLLLYLISISFIILNLITTMGYSTVRISDNPDQIVQYFGGTINVSLDSYFFLELFYDVFSILSFLSLWIATALIFINYKEKLSKNFLIIGLLCITLIYFILTYFVENLYSFIDEQIAIDPLLISSIFIVFVSLIKPIGGIIFGIVYLQISRLISYEKDISAFILMTGCGILLIFCTNQSILLVIAPYPPFGIATISILNIAAYFMVVGLYNTAKLVSYNNQLRHSILKLTSNSKLVSFIGQAEGEKEMEKLVSVINKNVTQIEPISNEKETLEFDTDELKKYIETIAEELQDKKT